MTSGNDYVSIDLSEMRRNRYKWFCPIVTLDGVMKWLIILLYLYSKLPFDRHLVIN